MSDTVEFYTSGFCSKWGFDDGDFIYENLFDESCDGGVIKDNHETLFKILKEFVIPKVTSAIDIVFIETCHNPVRTNTVDGVKADWYNDRKENTTSIVKPEVITVLKSDIIDFFQQTKGNP